MYLNICLPYLVSFTRLNERQRAEQRTFKKIVYYMPLLLMDIFRAISLGTDPTIKNI